MLHRSFSLVVFGGCWYLINYGTGFLLQLATSRRQAEDSRAAVIALNRTHFLVESSLPDFVHEHLQVSPQQNCKLLAAIPKTKDSPPITTLKSFLNRGSFTLIIL